VVGGTGALGRLAVRWIEHSTSAQVLLLARGPHQVPAGLASGGSMVEAQKADVSARGDAPLQAELGPLTGLLHLGGRIQDGAIARQDAPGLRATMSPKGSGTVNLHDLVAREAVAMAVLFSSASALLGNPGQLNYAAANGAADGLAAEWSQMGMPLMSLQWGPWRGGGMAARSSSVARRMSEVGVGMMDPTDGLRCLSRAASGHRFLRDATASFAPILIDANVFRQSSAGKKLALRLIVGTPLGDDALKLHDEDCEQQPETAASGGHAQLARALDIRKVVQEALHNVIGSSVSDNDLLVSAGVDSLGAVELRSALERSLGVELPPSVAFDHPTVTELVRYIEGRLQAHPARTAAPARPRLSGMEPAPTIETVVQCVHARVPGTVASISFSREPQLQSSLVPVSRWDCELNSAIFFTGRHAVLLNEDVSLFDGGAFGVSRTEAAFMDPQQRFLLDRDTSPFQATGSVASVASGRLSFTFGFKGPSVSIDTACSASLVAVHLGSGALHRGQCTSAVAAGANLILSPGKYFALTSASMLSLSGQCRPLDASADGYARGEAVVVVLLQAASPRGPSGLAAIRGSAVNQDGRSGSLTSPHGPSQQEVVSLACADAGTAPGLLGAVQMHGTGTQLGDPIETGSISGVLGTSHSPGGRSMAVLQACKSYLGHGEASAGISGLLHNAYAHCEGRLLGIRHLRRVNSHVAEILERSVRNSFDLQPCLEARGSAGLPPFGVSSFAYQGTNAHAVTAALENAAPAVLGTQHCWRRGRFWAGESLQHFLLQPHGALFSSGRLVFQARPFNRAGSFLLEHRVWGQSLMPASCHMEMAASACAAVLSSLHDRSQPTRLALSDCVMPRPMLLQADGASGAELSLADGRTQISLRVDGSERVATCFSGGTVRCRSLGPRPTTSRVPEFPGLLDMPRRALAALAGTTIGFINAKEEEQRPSHVSLKGAATMHPAVLDACLQAGHQAVADVAQARTLVPVGFGALSLAGQSPSSGVHASAARDAAASGANYNFAGSRGARLGILCEMQAREIKGISRAPDVRVSSLTGMQTLRLGVEWSCSSPVGKMQRHADPEWLYAKPSSNKLGPCLSLEALLQATSYPLTGQLAVCGDDSLALGIGGARAAPCPPRIRDCHSSLWGLIQTAALEHRGSLAFEARAQDSSKGSVVISRRKANVVAPKARAMLMGVEHRSVLRAIRGPGHVDPANEDLKKVCRPTRQQTTWTAPSVILDWVPNHADCLTVPPSAPLPFCRLELPASLGAQ